MTKIGLIADTHGWLDENVFKHFKSCHEIWHAGDFGNIEIAEKLSNFRRVDGEKIILKGVYGNIDGNDVRSVYPQTLTWNCEDVRI